MNRTPELRSLKSRSLLYGINQLKTDAQILGYDDRGRLTATDVKLTLILTMLGHTAVQVLWQCGCLRN